MQSINQLNCTCCNYQCDVLFTQFNANDAFGEVMKKNIKASWLYKVYPVCSITLVTSNSIMIKTLVVIKFGEIVFFKHIGDTQMHLLYEPWSL